MLIATSFRPVIATGLEERFPQRRGGKGAGGPGADTIRTGGRVPWGAEVEFAYTTGYDSRGRVSVNHIVDERGYGALLSKRDGV